MAVAEKKEPPKLGGVDRFLKHVRRIVTSVEYITTTPYVDFSHEIQQFAKLCPTIAWHLTNTIIYGPLSDIDHRRPKEVEIGIREAISEVVDRSSLAEGAGAADRYIAAISKIAQKFATSKKDPDAEYITLEYTVLKQYDMARASWGPSEEVNKLVFLTASIVLAAKILAVQFDSFKEKYIGYIFESAIKGSSKIAKGYFPGK